MNILLDYFFPITTIEPTPEASTAFLKQVLVVVAPADSVPTGVITLCTSKSAVAALTDNTESDQLFDAGMTRVYILPMDDLDIADVILGHENDFYTILISSDFADSAIAGGSATLDLGAFEGVVGVSSADDAFLALQAAISKRAAFHTTSSNKAKNMFYAFGKLLSNALNWNNQQYISMPLADDVDNLGDAETLFDDRINFVISDEQYSNRLALFAAGGQAIAAPYIVKNLEIDLQSRAFQYVADNQPDYTLKEAALVQDELQTVMDEYIANDDIEAGTVSVGLEADNFVASADMNISEPKALWRIFGEVRQTL